MVKKFTTNCDFGGQKAPVHFYVGNPSLGTHPLNFQSRWLANNRGGNIPNEIMESFQRIADIAVKNRLPFEDLCAYVIDELNSNNSLANDVKKASALSASKNSEDKK
jgi:hypothetical protein